MKYKNAEQEELVKAYHRRSEPGKGEPVYIVNMGPDEYGEDETPGPDADVTTTQFGFPVEDFADCHWPITVKVKPGTHSRYVVKALRILADYVADDPEVYGNFGEEKPDNRVNAWINPDAPEAFKKFMAEMVAQMESGEFSEGNGDLPF